MNELLEAIRVRRESRWIIWLRESRCLGILDKAHQVGQQTYSILVVNSSSVKGMGAFNVSILYHNVSKVHRFFIFLDFWKIHYDFKRYRKEKHTEQERYSPSGKQQLTVR